jgi:hypothetical protein
MEACPLYSQRLKRLRKKLSSTATLGCASMIMAAKPAQARVPVLLKAALNRLFPYPVKPRGFCRPYVVAEATTHEHHYAASPRDDGVLRVSGRDSFSR